MYISECLKIRGKVPLSIEAKKLCMSDNSAQIDIYRLKDNVTYILQTLLTKDKPFKGPKSWTNKESDRQTNNRQTEKLQQLHS